MFLVSTTFGMSSGPGALKFKRAEGVPFDLLASYSGERGGFIWETREV